MMEKRDPVWQRVADPMTGALVKDRTAVVGIGQTAFGKGLADTELSLACQAIVDGDRRRRPRALPTSTGSRCSRWRTAARSTSPATSGSATSRASRRSASAAAPAAASSARPRWRWPPGSARSRSRGGPASGVGQGQPAVGAGGGPARRPPAVEPAVRACSGPVDEIAMLTRRAMHEYGYTRDHLANVALAFRKHANRNPHATMGHKPLTREQYMDARWISEPLCLFDNCLETDGALAVVITTRRAGPRPPAAAGVHPLVRAEHPAAAPGDDQLLLRGSAARPVVGVRARCCGSAATSDPPTCPSRSSTTRSAR